MYTTSNGHMNSCTSVTTVVAGSFSGACVITSRNPARGGEKLAKRQQ